MIVNKPGKYILTKDWHVITSNAAYVYPEGNILDVTQIDAEYHKVVGVDFPDWVYWDLPVEVYIEER